MAETDNKDNENNKIRENSGDVSWQIAWNCWVIKRTFFFLNKKKTMIVVSEDIVIVGT